VGPEERQQRRLSDLRVSGGPAGCRAEAGAAQRLELPELRPFVEESLPMLVGMPEQIKIRPVGGKGL
jgi:hypothetical protein